MMITTVLKSTFKILQTDKFVSEEDVVRFTSFALSNTPKTNISMLLRYLLP
jgi:hypothetical protein